MSAAVEVRERPILFSAPMVRAILDGAKTQTRRVVKPQPTDPRVFACRNGLEWCGDAGVFLWDARWEDERGRHGEFVGNIRCPYGQPGDRMWVREVFCYFGAGGAHIGYRATDEENICEDAFDHWRPSIHMPRWASRITLEVTDVRVERVQEITERDAQTEGVAPYIYGEGPVSEHAYWSDGGFHNGRGYRDGFEMLWDEINGPRGYGWQANPWVWVVSFRRVTP